jgi:hypothetical protein
MNFDYNLVDKIATILNPELAHTKIEINLRLKNAQTN